MATQPAPRLEVVRDPQPAASLLHPLRVDLLRRLAEPQSASGLARRLRQPRQRLNYHLRELEREGLVELVEERRKGNCVERVLRATARAYVISPGALGALASADPGEVRDRFSAAYLIALAAQALRDVAELRARAEGEGKRLATFALQVDVRFASAADRSAFAEELANAVAGLAARYHDERAAGGRAFRFLVGGYPAAAAVPEGGSPAAADLRTTSRRRPPRRMPRIPRSRRP